MKLGVIGYPIKHSKSPIIHQYWMDSYDIQGTYNLIEIKPENFKEEINSLIHNGFDGFNVTVPYKEKIMLYCDDIDDTAKKIGAVNTVIIKNKKLIGMNTDAFGFIENIKSDSKFNFKQKKCLVIGAGGASKAVIYGLIESGVSKILLANRTKEKAENIKNIFGNKIEVINFNEIENYLSSVDLLVNTTLLGMTGQNNLNLSLKNLNKKALVADIVYNPLMTDLLKEAEMQGVEIVTGIGMLLHQARPAFQAWIGIMPDLDKTLQNKVLS